jgi:hypothetical protein
MRPPGFTVIYNDACSLLREEGIAIFGSPMDCIERRATSLPSAASKPGKDEP